MRVRVSAVLVLVGVVDAAHAVPQQQRLRVGVRVGVRVRVRRYRG